MTDQIQNFLLGLFAFSLFIIFILLNKKHLSNDKDGAGGTWMLFVDRIMDTVDIIVGQVTSGRWLLTVAAGICLIHFAWMADQASKDKVIDLIKDIVIFYFVVRDAASAATKATNGGKDEKTVNTTAVVPNTDAVKPADSV